VTLCDAATDRQSDAGALVRLPPVKSLEGHEDLIGETIFEADAVVADPELPARDGIP